MNTATTTRPQRRGRSPERATQHRGENLSGQLWLWESELRGLRCITPELDTARVRAANALGAARGPVAVWLRLQEREARLAEALAPLRA